MTYREALGIPENDALEKMIFERAALCYDKYRDEEFEEDDEWDDEDECDEEDD